MTRQNIFQMYVENDWSAGFWVTRNTWMNVIAEVRSIDGKTSGELDGNPPYFKNQKVYGNVHDISTGKLLDENILISCPGNYSYQRIPKPEWNRAGQAQSSAMIRETFGEFTVNSRVKSPRFGSGTILEILGKDEMTTLRIAFDDHGEKRIVVKFGNLQSVTR